MNASTGFCFSVLSSEVVIPSQPLATRYAIALCFRFQLQRLTNPDLSQMKAKVTMKMKSQVGGDWGQLHADGRST